MKKMQFCCLAVAFCLVTACFAGAEIIVQDPGRSYESSPLAASCAVSATRWGAPVTDVSVLTMYWLQWYPDPPGSCFATIKYVVKYTVPIGVSKSKEVHSFSTQSGTWFCGGWSIPFAIDSGFTNSGPAVLKIKTDIGTCTYSFNRQ